MPLTDLPDILPGIAALEAEDPEAYPARAVAALQAAGVSLAPLPKHLGGEAATLLDAVRAVEAVATASPSLALLLSMPLGLAGIYALGPEVAPAEHRAAWAAQIDEVAANYRAGHIYAACNSERGAGGSLAATKTVATRDAEGFRITGEKILASSGTYAQHFFSTAKVQPEDLPGCGIVEFFFVAPDAQGVRVMGDWDGFGMRSTESHTVSYEDAPVEALMGFPNFLAAVQPLQYFFCLFAAIPLGCAASILSELSDPPPTSPALRVRLSDARMRLEAMRAYLHEAARAWRPAAGPEYAAQVLRTKTYVSQEATKLAAELFALSGGRHYRRDGKLARTLADSFAGTALRPPLPLALEALIEA